MREGGVLGEEPVAGMDGIGVHLPCGREQRVLVQIRLERGRRADRDRPVRGERVRRAAVGLGIHGHGLEAGLVAGARDADRDLAAVRDEDTLHRHIRKTPKPVAGIGAFSATAIPSASVSRVSSGSRMPSSQSRAVA